MARSSSSLPLGTVTVVRCIPFDARLLRYRACRSEGSPAMARSSGVSRFATRGSLRVDVDALNAVDDDELQSLGCEADGAGSLIGETKVR